MRIVVRGLISAMLIAAAGACAACGESTPTQPTEDVCAITAADPPDMAQIKAGVPVTITLTGRCTLASAAGATVVMTASDPQAGLPLGSASREVSRGTTTVRLSVTVTPPGGPFGQFVLVIMYIDTNPEAATSGRVISYNVIP
jgi:hypothetical protein